MESLRKEREECVRDRENEREGERKRESYNYFNTKSKNYTKEIHHTFDFR